MREFEPPALLRNPHVQAVASSSPLRRTRIERDTRELRAASTAEIVDAGDGVRLLAHHTPPRGPAGRLVVVLHGWEGSAEATYTLAAADGLWRAGFRVVRLNLRDHGGSHHLNEALFHSCRLAEVLGAVAALAGRFPAESPMLAGFSLGGNFALRIAARASAAGLRLDRVAAICPVLDPARTMAALDGGWIGYRLYFLRRWRRSLEAKRAAFPALYDFGDLRRFRTLEAMTDYFVRAYTEFPDLASYLDGYAVTGDRLAGITAPTRVLLAADDPVIPIEDAARVDWPAAVRVERSRFGGHCGFMGDYRFASPLDGWLVDALTGS